MTITTAEIGRTTSCNFGATTSNPSTADSTEIAGVITPSPKNRQQPLTPISARMRRIRAPVQPRWASTIRARMPPSPRLSARITSDTYLMVTISTSDQKISDKMPNRSPSRMWAAPKCSMLALKAYSGLVPISP